MIESVLDVTTADGVQGVLTKRADGEGPFPAVVMFHDGPGATGDLHLGFGGADHGVAVPGPTYSESAASRSYEQALALFARPLV